MLEAEVNELRDRKCKEAGANVVKHDAGTAVEAFELPDGRRLEDVEGAKEDERECGMLPVGRDGDQGDELAGDLVDDDMAGIFAAGFAGNDGSGGYADQCGDDRRYRCPNGERKRSWLKNMGGSEPEQYCGDAAVGAGAGLKQARSKEGPDEPRPKCFLFRRRMGLDVRVGH